jgi:hypothetical protein
MLGERHDGIASRIAARVREERSRLTIRLLLDTVLASLLHRLIDGDDVLDAIEKVPVDGKDRPTHEIRITSITIHANPLADQQR